jgi:hypothetical protein
MPEARGTGKIDRDMATLAAPEPISPELVLVSPPELVQHARHKLPVPAWWLARFEQELGRVEMVAVWLFCVVMTVGPVLFLLAMRP